MCETDQPSTPEPPRIDDKPPDRGRIEISTEETQELAKDLTKFSEEVGFNETLYQTAHILVLCLHSNQPLDPDLAQLCELVGCSPKLATRVMERVKKYEIFQGFTWPNERGEIAFMLDTMVAAGLLQRKTGGEDLEYSLEPEHDYGFFTNDHVKHKSGFGSGWYIAAKKHNAEGRQLVRLKKSHTAPDRGGRWRDASNYVRAK